MLNTLIGSQFSAGLPVGWYTEGDFLDMTLPMLLVIAYKCTLNILPSIVYLYKKAVINVTIVRLILIYDKDFIKNRE